MRCSSLIDDFQQARASEGEFFFLVLFSHLSFRTKVDSIEDISKKNKVVINKEGLEF